MLLQRRSLLAAPLLLASPGLAQPAWPARGPVRLIPTAPPGGLVDTIARLIAPPLGEFLGQWVVVENRPGAGGVTGTDFVAKQPPDGNTFLMTQAGVMVCSAATPPRRRACPSTRSPTSRIWACWSRRAACCWCAPTAPSAPWPTTWPRRARPVRYGSSGIGSALHILGAMLTGAAGLREHDHVPFQGSAPALQALLGGHIDRVFDPITTNVAAMRQGSLRALAVSTPQRLAAFPELPTFAEQGFPSIVQSIWLGLSGPAGLPAPIAERMQAAIPLILQAPAVQARTAELVTLPRNPPPLGPAFVEIMRADMATARDVARRYNITAA